MTDRRGPARLSDQEYYHLLLNLGNPIPAELAARVCDKINLSRRPSKVRQDFDKLIINVTY